MAVLSNSKHLPSTLLLENFFENILILCSEVLALFKALLNVLKAGSVKQRVMFLQELSVTDLT